MNNLHNWLRSTRAADVMTEAVAVMRVFDPICAAASTLRRLAVSGVPVVDDGGICVGVLSARDILNFENRLTTKSGDRADEPASCPQPDEVVGRFMTRDVVGVGRETTLDVVVSRMFERGIHRIVVLSPNGRVEGIISTSDVLNALMRASVSDDADESVGWSTAPRGSTVLMR